MRRILFFIALFLSASFATAQAPSYTPNFQFQIPAYGTSNWQVPLDYNFNLLDQILAGGIPTGGISTWSSTTTYQVGQLIIFNGQGYVSLQNGNTGNTPSFPSSVWWTNNLAPVAAQTVSGSLTTNRLPKANGPSSLINSSISDDNTNAAWSPGIPGGAFTFNGNIGTTGTAFLTAVQTGATVSGTGLFSGLLQVGLIGNTTPGVPISFTCGGCAANSFIALFPSAIEVDGAISVGNNHTFGISGQCLLSQGSTSAPIWGSCGTGGGSITLPASGIPFMTSTTTGTAATSPQLVTALNVSPSSTFSASLIPTLNQNTTGSAASATTAASLSAASALPNNTTATTQTVGDNTTKVATDAFVLANAGGGTNPIIVHSLTGASPTAVVNSITVPAFDTENFTLSTNTTAINLPASSAIADGEVLTFAIAQPASGGPFTVAAGDASSPLTHGTGTTVQNMVPGGCPNIGSTVGSAPSQLLLSVGYKASVTQYQVLGCQTLPAQTAVVEGTITGAVANYGQFAAPTFLLGTKMTNAGHFSNIQVVNVSPTACTIGPTINVENITQGTFGAAGVVGPNTGSATGNILNGSQVLTYNAGDSVAVYVSVTGTSCPNNFAVAAQYVSP